MVPQLNAYYGRVGRAVMIRRASRSFSRHHIVPNRGSAHLKLEDPEFGSKLSGDLSEQYTDDRFPRDTESVLWIGRTPNAGVPNSDILTFSQTDPFAMLELDFPMHDGIETRIMCRRFCTLEYRYKGFSHCWAPPPDTRRVLFGAALAGGFRFESQEVCVPQ